MSAHFTCVTDVVSSGICTITYCEGIDTASFSFINGIVIVYTKSLLMYNHKNICYIKWMMIARFIRIKLSIVF